MTTAQSLYGTISTNDKYHSIRWIANVVLTSCRKPTTRLKALVKLVDAGHEIETLDFIMPYQGLRVDGVAVMALPLLDRGELVEYSSDWYKH